MEQLQDKLIKELVKRIDKLENTISIYEELTTKQDELINNYKREIDAYLNNFPKIPKKYF